METIKPSEESNRKNQPKLNTTSHLDGLPPNQLISAGYQVLNYLKEKRHFTHQSVGNPTTTVLEIALQSALKKLLGGNPLGGNPLGGIPLGGNQLHPSGKRDAECRPEVLYQSIQKGLIVMKEDYHTAKAALQQKNEQYIAQQNCLSEEGKKHIRQEADKGEFRVANGQRGYIAASRIEAIHKTLSESKAKAVDLKPTQSVHDTTQVKDKEKSVGCVQLESLVARSKPQHTTPKDISSGQMQKARKF